MSKKRVKRKLPDAYCVRLLEPIDGKKFIVWPGKVQPRGFERGAIGLGRTSAEAWIEAKKNIKEQP
jgi:hypothetical protein